MLLLPDIIITATRNVREWTTNPHETQCRQCGAKNLYSCADERTNKDWEPAMHPLTNSASASVFRGRIVDNNTEAHVHLTRYDDKWRIGCGGVNISDAVDNKRRVCV